jgi:hypothetical protein
LDQGRRNLNVQLVPELAQFSGRARVREEDLVDIERIQCAGAVAIDGIAGRGDEYPQLGIGVLGDHGASDPQGSRSSFAAQRQSLSLYMGARRPCPVYVLYFDGADLGSEVLPRSGTYTIVRPGTASKRAFAAVVPSTAPAGTYRVCDTDVDICGSLMVSGV